MKPIVIFIVLLLSVLTMSSKSYGHDKPPALEGPYLGQKPPGSIPKVFAPSGLSTEHRDGSGFFTPDMKEFYFTRRSSKDGSWGAAINLGDTINTSGNEGGPNVTPDGKYLFFNRYISEENAGIYWVDAQIIETLRPKP